MFRDPIIRISGAVVWVTRPGILSRMIHWEVVINANADSELPPNLPER
jgi:hypothetical protein